MQSLPRSIYFVGIAGIGMSALAQLAQAQGCLVTGADPQANPHHNPAVARLLQKGAAVYTAHSAGNLPAEADMVVVSAAVPQNNAECEEAQKRGIPILSRARFLGRIMQAHTGPRVAVAGTHGKTTTTSMAGVMLQHASAAPTVLTGGEARQLGGNLLLGDPQGPFVAEACEAYGSFLELHPNFALLTSVEADHLDYYKNMQGVREAFGAFLHNLAEQQGTLVYCADNAEAAMLAAQSRCRLLPYRLSDAEELLEAPFPSFVWRGEQVRLRIPGLHNIQNALGVLTLGEALGLAAKEAAQGVNSFEGVGRRLEFLGEAAVEGGKVQVIDDYAHHPAEIDATLAALRLACPHCRLVAVFQPHLYSRTRDFLPQFAESLGRADAVVVTGIYPAREAPIPEVRASDIVSLLASQQPCIPAVYLPDAADVPCLLRGFVKDGDAVAFLGAGDIRDQAEAFLSAGGSL